MADLARIKSNVAKMAAQNAPEADIDGYIASEGVTVDDVRNFRPEASPTAPAVDPEITKAADAYEQARGTSAFADATDAGVSGIPFADELYSAVSSLPNAAVSAIRGRGFHPVDEYDRSQALQAELERRRNERHPIATKVGAIAGGVGATAPLSAGGLSFMNGAKPTLLSLGTRGAAEGAAYGGVYGLGEGDGLKDRLFNAATGAGFGGLVGGGLGGLARIGAGKVDSAALPTVEDLKSAAQAAYQKAEDAGVVYSKDAIGRVTDALKQQFADFGYHPELQSGAKVALGEMDRLAGDNATLKGLDTARKVAGNAFQPGNKANNALTGKVTSAIDDLVTNPQAGDVVMGDSGLASEALQEARGLYSQASKLDTVNSLLDRAGRRAASTGSGGNVENTTRQELNKILNSERMQRGFTPDELDAVRKAVVGSKGQDLLRLVGKLSPEGNGLALIMHLLGGAATGGHTLPLAAAGMMAKRGAEAMSRNSAKVAEAIIASGGKLPEAILGGGRKAIVGALARPAGQAALMNRN